MSSKICICRGCFTEQPSGVACVSCAKVEAERAAPVVERQPVAWEVYWDDDGSYYFTSRRKERADKLLADPDFKIVPLYTAPPELAELQAVTLPSVQDDGAEGRGYNKALRDCAAALEAAGVPFTNDPRTIK